MKRILIILTVLFTALPATAKVWKAETPEKCDPYMKAQGGYGYLVEDGPQAAVWWAEGCYKPMKDTPVARRRGREVKLSAARHEWESFIVVINPKQELKDIKVAVDGLPEGITATVRKVEYVTTYYTNDSYGWPGEWPDPLPLYEQPENAPMGQNTSFWITLYTPAGQAPGTYTGSVSLSDAGGWSIQIPVSLKVRPITLPATPTLHSGFGFRFDHVIAYENLKTQEQKEEAFRNYLEMYHDYRISPSYAPFYLTPARFSFEGIDWQGGNFDAGTHTSGRYSYLVDDSSPTANAAASATDKFITIRPDRAYSLVFQAKSDNSPKSAVAVDFYDENHNKIEYRTVWHYFETGQEWKADTLQIKRIPSQAAYAAIRLFGCAAMTAGNTTGRTWYDDIRFLDGATGENLLPQGGFEPDTARFKVHIDWSDFEKTAAKYYGETPWFTGFTFDIPVLHNACGYPFGTPEHEIIFKDCVQQIEAEFEKLNLLDKAYIYWVDEPFPDAYPMIHATNALIKKHAPRLRPFAAEQFPFLLNYKDDERLEIMDVTDISCVSWNCLDNHNKIKQINAMPGKEVWTYLCTATRAPFFTNFIDHDAIDMRMWIWATRTLDLKGILIWRNNYWNSQSAVEGGMMQNPWDEPASFVYFDRSSEMTNDIWGNGDGRLFYPNNRHPGVDTETPYTGRPVPCVRLEILRDGIEDYEYLHLLEEKIPQMSASDARKARSLLKLPPEVFQDDNEIHDEKYYIKDPQYLLQRREQIARLIEKYK